MDLDTRTLTVSVSFSADFIGAMYPIRPQCEKKSPKRKNYIASFVPNVAQSEQMKGLTLDSSVNVRLAKPVIMHLRRLADQEDLKVADLVRKAIKKTYGTPKK